MATLKKVLLPKKKIILCFLKFYLPGYKHGGPIRSIANFVENFGDEYDIRIVCSSGDTPDKKPYKGIVVEKWNQVGKAKVFYVSNKISKFKKIFELINRTDYSILYLNSFFTFTFSIFPLLILQLNFIKLKSCIIAPRGEFAKNAIKLKKMKKIFYLFIVKTIGLYKNLCWQASSELELVDIRRQLGSTANVVKIAPDLIFSKKYVPRKIFNKKKNTFKMIFLSRISPMKNLDFLIDVLIDVSCPLELSIHGPKDDLQYWSLCKKLINKLPTHIKINISNEVLPNKVIETFGKYDLFVFPTRGENFGHVIPESLSASTPVLLSDQTHWQNDPLFGLQILPLKKKAWIKAIEKWVSLSDKKLLMRKKAALNYANKIKLKNEKSILTNTQLFEYKSSCLN